MEISFPTAPGDLPAFDAFVRRHSEGTLWQSIAWKGYQEALGRETRLYLLRDSGALVGGALVAIDRTVGNLGTWDIPRGPLVGGDGDPAVRTARMAALLGRVIDDARKDRCLRVTCSPLIPLPAIRPRFRPSGRHLQPEATRILDLTLDEEALFAQMKPKGRYNIAVAERHGIAVTEAQDIGAFYALLQQTAARDHFRILQKSHYAAFLDALPGSFLLMASCPSEGAPKAVAGLLGVVWGTTGIYYYGASSYAERAMMAPYLLQREAMRRCRAAGCTRYDLLGVAPPDAPEGHPWKGISSFKEKFGGALVTYPPEAQVTLRPVTAGLLGAKRRMFG